MLTDEDLTDQVGAAFRACTRDLEYGGPVPRLRHTGVTLVAPAAAMLAATLVVVPNALSREPDPHPTAGPPGAPGSQSSATPTGRLITAHLSIGRYRLTYARVAGEPDPLFFVSPEALPDDAVPVDGLPDQAWVGTDPATSANAVFFTMPWHDWPGGERLLALESSTWSQEQLVNLLRNGDTAH
jgi:hypothetical protein